MDAKELLILLQDKKKDNHKEGAFCPYTEIVINQLMYMIEDYMYDIDNNVYVGKLLRSEPDEIREFVDEFIDSYNYSDLFVDVDNQIEEEFYNVMKDKEE